MNRDIRIITNHVCETNDYIDHFYVSTWGVCHLSTREGQQELNRVLLVFFTYLYKRSTRCPHVSKVLIVTKK